MVHVAIKIHIVFMSTAVSIRRSAMKPKPIRNGILQIPYSNNNFELIA